MESQWCSNADAGSGLLFHAAFKVRWAFQAGTFNSLPQVSSPGWTTRAHRRLLSGPSKTTHANTYPTGLRKKRWIRNWSDLSCRLINHIQYLTLWIIHLIQKCSYESYERTLGVGHAVTPWVIESILFTCINISCNTVVMTTSLVKIIFTPFVL